MSKYGWERGTIIIPAGQWAKFRTDLIKAWNDKQSEMLALAQRAHKAAITAAKGKRGENREKAIGDAIARECGGTLSYGNFEPNSRSSYWGGTTYDETASEKWQVVADLLGIHRWDVSEPDLHAPKKKDLKVYPTSKSCCIRFSDACVTFNNDDKTVTWDVGENNHAVENARGHWFADKLFTALNKIEWKRGSGGQIVGNDEYNRDNRDSGGGGNYVTATYAPKPKGKKSSGGGGGGGATHRRMVEWEQGASGRYW